MVQWWTKRTCGQVGQQSQLELSNGGELRTRQPEAEPGCDVRQISHGGNVGKWVYRISTRSNERHDCVWCEINQRPRAQSSKIAHKRSDRPSMFSDRDLGQLYIFRRARPFFYRCQLQAGGNLGQYHVAMWCTPWAMSLFYEMFFLLHLGTIARFIEAVRAQI